MYTFCTTFVDRVSNKDIIAMKKFKHLIIFTAIFLIFACSPPQPTSLESNVVIDKTAITIKAGAPLFDNMGVHQHLITTSVPAAQMYFDQGLVLAFGFNHAESIRSFQAAQRLDPDCAMCFWGEALATGPNINVTSNGKAVMSGDDRKSAFAALQKALALKDKASVAEQNYIEALATRYNGKPGSDRAILDIAYANSMRDLANKYPQDNDAAALFAEALMNTMPWDYWLDAEQPKPATVEVINTLESVMKRQPEHPLALHLYIHAVEASNQPGRAEVAADTLADLVPGSGHLVHMPAHIYWRVGRYNDAVKANIQAATVDEEYIAACNAQGFYPALYYPHNIHFLWAASSMMGNSKLAIESARKVAANVRLEMIEQFPTVEFFKTIPILALTQFGRWDEILAEPLPPAKLQFSTAIHHYARGVALVRKDDLNAAKTELEALQPLMDSDVIHTLDGSDYPASVLLSIADELLKGEIALASGKNKQAIDHFTSAVAQQDKLPYMEPPFWYYPTRQSLGQALVIAGEYVSAEQVYRKDLAAYPKNGWSMFGLIQSLEAQGKQEEAYKVKEMFDIVWSMSDVKLESSRL
ncbi:MAG: tetratricopeptide (TPR) repeat protein [Patiriisocius sp.]